MNIRTAETDGLNLIAGDEGTALDAILAPVPTGGQGLETGSKDGRKTRHLLRRLSPETLRAVDPWAPVPVYEDKAFGYKARAHVHETAYQAMLALAETVPGLTAERAASDKVLAGLPDASLDWVFLDGCKYYPDLLGDLEEACRVVRPGGFILGAGLNWAPQLGYPVRAALDDVCARLPASAIRAQEGDFFSLQTGADTRPAARPAKTSYLVISTMKNEAPFILEWVAHYRALGFSDFLIYTNDCDDATVPLLDRLSERGIVRHEPNAVLKRGPHKSALKYAHDHVLTQRADWVLICDVDEFLNLRTDHARIQDFIADLPDDTDILPFPWLIFGTSHIERFEDSPVTEQFVRCEAPPRRGGRKTRDIKSMFRGPARMDRFGLHRPRFRDNQTEGLVWRTPDGNEISDEMNSSSKWQIRWRAAHKWAYMNHYPLRSIEAYIIKKNRGRANHVNEDLGQAYFDKWNSNAHKDYSLKRNSAAMRRELDALMSDEETAALHAQGVADFRDKLATLLQEPAYARLFDDLRRADRRDSSAG